MHPDSQTHPLRCKNQENKSPLVIKTSPRGSGMSCFASHMDSYPCTSAGHLTPPNSPSSPAERRWRRMCSRGPSRELKGGLCARRQETRGAKSSSNSRSAAPGSGARKEEMQELELISLSSVAVSTVLGAEDKGRALFAPGTSACARGRPSLCLSLSELTLSLRRCKRRKPLAHRPGEHDRSLTLRGPNRHLPTWGPL